MMFVQSIFHNVWTKVDDQEARRLKKVVCCSIINKKRVVVFHQVRALFYEVVNEKPWFHVKIKLF